MSENQESDLKHHNKDTSLGGVVKIDLFGTEFRFQSDDQVANPEQVAEDVRSYIEDAESQIPHTSSGKNKMAILLLAAINISSELCALRRDYSQLEARIEKRITSLLEKVNREIH